MNGETRTESEAPRPRPLSTGLWTLLSWLRRDDSSTESLSSVGSDGTAASFAFLAAPHARSHRSRPVRPPSPPTDTYKKRVHERNLRRQYDRDLTLHRKYGLLRSEGGYDAFSLPSARRGLGDCINNTERERRATSECLQRRVAHVPGKRRAPAPPVSSNTTSLRYRNGRKRPAPQPPFKPDAKTANSAEMNSKPNQRPLSTGDVFLDCKPEKYSKKNHTVKETKPRNEKGFLKNIFDNKKKNSSTDIVPMKVLPSISELDKQAAEIIESCKQNAAEQDHVHDEGAFANGRVWICTRCLRKYSADVANCLHCLPDDVKLPYSKLSKTGTSASNSYTQTTSNNSKSSVQKMEEKQELKKLLKEMKDSIPKKGKTDVFKKPQTKNIEIKNRNLETPTLPIGLSISKGKEVITDNLPSTSLICGKSVENDEIDKPETKGEKAPVVTMNPIIVKELQTNNAKNKPEKGVEVNISSENRAVDNLSNRLSIEVKNLHTPLKISSLLNPIYVPKQNGTANAVKTNVISASIENKIVTAEFVPKPLISKVNIIPLTSTVFGKANTSTSQVNFGFENSNNKPGAKNCNNMKETNKNENKIGAVETKLTPTLFPCTSATTTAPPVSNASSKTFNSQISEATPSISSPKNAPDSHSKRRDLINQLEQSIAKGDERLAADAAVRLAQLRLSCSVLSFSSQIVGRIANNSFQNDTVINSEPKQSPTSNNKVNTAVQATTKMLRKDNNTNNALKEKVTDQQQNNNSPVEESKPLLEKTLKDQQGIKDLQRPSTSNQTMNNDGINLVPIEVWVEDRNATRGPIELRITRAAVLGELRERAEESFGLAKHMQRWIVGRTLCADDTTSLASLAGPDLSAPFYLCLVESDASTQMKIQNIKTNTKSGLPSKNGQTQDVYTELVQLEQRALVSNTEPFECGVCMDDCGPDRGAVLRECVHTFCRSCLSDLIRHCEEAAVTCPAMGCAGTLQEREIRALVSPEDYERWLARGLAAAESGTRNAFHCRTRDCKGWALCEPGVLRFPCPVCKRTNCVPCQAIHEGESCQEHRKKIEETETSTDSTTDEGTKALLDTLIKKGEALPCPECSAIITKKWGCDWIKCSACKTEICWVTRGRRWGPGGRGDTSAGCRCGVDGKRCHPLCGYCH